MSRLNRGGRGRAFLGANSGASVGGDEPEDRPYSADVGVYFSATLERRQEELLNISHKKRRLEPTELNDVLAEWTPAAVEVDWDPDDHGANDDPENGAPAADAPVVGASVLGKRKVYESSVSGLLSCVTVSLTALQSADRPNALVEPDGRFLFG